VPAPQPDVHAAYCQRVAAAAAPRVDLEKVLEFARRARPLHLLERPVPGLPRRFPSTRRTELIANRVVQKRGDAAGEEVIVRVGYPAGGTAP
jgi:hypothetical protein